MKCRWCNGRGDHGTYDPHDPQWQAAVGYDEADIAEADEDPGVSLCEFCGGTGRVPVIVVLVRWADHHWTEARRWLRYESAPGCWWWERFGCRLRARRLARRGGDCLGNNLESVLARRRERLRVFISSPDPACRVYVIAERRMGA